MSAEVGGISMADEKPREETGKKSFLLPCQIGKDILAADSMSGYRYASR
jgi:hypothetical protein